MNGNMHTLLVVPLGDGDVYSMTCPRYRTLRDALQQVARMGVFAKHAPNLKIYEDLTIVQRDRRNVSDMFDVPIRADIIVVELERQVVAEAWEWTFPV